MFPTIIEIDGDLMKEDTLEQWRLHFHKASIDRVTENGKFPHREGSTGLAMELNGIDKIISLAKLGAKVKRSSGKRAKVIAADYLRQVADGLAN